MQTPEFLKRIIAFPFSLGPKGSNILLKMITECALIRFTVYWKTLKMQLTEIMFLELTLLFGRKLPSFLSFSVYVNIPFLCV